MDGLTATGEIRRLPGERSRVPIVALSASVTPEETDGFVAAGMDGYVAKPIDPAALAAVLAGLPGIHPVDAGPSGSQEPPAVEVVDERQLRLLLDALGSAKVSELIEGLEAETGPHSERLAAACASGDLVAARAAAHAVRGIATSLGMAALADLSEAIEDAAVRGDAERITTLLNQLDGAIRDGVARLRILCAAGLEGGGSGVGDPR
jgi:CheY-like chemotaxis protein